MEGPETPIIGVMGHPVAARHQVRLGDRAEHAEQLLRQPRLAAALANIPTIAPAMEEDALIKVGPASGADSTMPDGSTLRRSQEEDQSATTQLAGLNFMGGEGDFASSPNDDDGDRRTSSTYRPSDLKPEQPRKYLKGMGQDSHASAS